MHGHELPQLCCRNVLLKEIQHSKIHSHLLIQLTIFCLERWKKIK